ncbi:hypothetical protein JCM39194_03510 [Desulfotomaculum varum]
MWVYWLTLGALASILYFPYKKIFSQPVALRASLGTFVLGMAYPLLQANLSVAQTFLCLGLLLLFLGVTAAGSHTDWDKQKDAAETNQASQPDTTESSASDISEAPQPVEPEATKEVILGERDDKEPVTVTSETTPAHMQPEQTTVALPEEQQWEIMADRVEHTAEVVAAEAVTYEETDCLAEVNTGEKDKKEIDEDTDATGAVNGATKEANCLVAQASVGETETANLPATGVPQEGLPGLQQDSVSDLDCRPPDDGQPLPHKLLAEGLRLAKHKKYAQAVRCLNQVIAGGAEPEMLYLAVSQLSSIYQHLGLYPMAWEIINVFAEHPSLKDHPGQANLLQKAKFIRCLMDLLNRDRYGHIPYEQVPESVRREAFDNSLNIKYLIS